MLSNTEKQRLISEILVHSKSNAISKGSIEIEARIQGGNPFSLIEGDRLSSFTKQDYVVEMWPSGHRKIGDLIERKIKKNIFCTEYPITLSTSLEREVEVDESKLGKVSFRRSIKRWSRPLDEFFKLDVSCVLNENISNSSESNTVEVEIDGTVSWDTSPDILSELVDKLFVHVAKVFKDLFDCPYPIPSSRESSLIREVILNAELFARLAKNPSSMMKENESDLIKRIRMTLPSELKPKLDARYFVKPVDLHISDMLSGRPCITRSKFSVCYKTDGLRGTMFFSHDGIYTFGSGRSMKKISHQVVNGCIGLIMEVEYILPNGGFSQNQGKLLTYVFDVFTYPSPIEKGRREGLYVTSYLGRLREAQKLMSKCKLEDFDLIFKEHDEFGDAASFSSVMRKYLSDEALACLKSEPEGIIITPLNTSPDVYMNSSEPSIFKWKFKMTIDMSPMLMDDRIIGCVLYDSGIEPFMVDGNFVEIIGLNTEHIDFGVVVEVEYDSEHNESNRFIFKRSRGDKMVPNKIETATNVWNLIKKPLKRETLFCEDISVMRAFHNVVKSKCLSSAKTNPCNDFHLIDIGSGK